MRLRYFKNDFGRDSEGHCCSGKSDTVTRNCIGGCKTRFRVCLKHYQAKIDTTSQCTYGDVVTPILGENSVNLTDTNNFQNKGFTNPIQFAFNFAWPVSCTLLIICTRDGVVRQCFVRVVFKIAQLNLETIQKWEWKWGVYGVCTGCRLASHSVDTSRHIRCDIVRCRSTADRWCASPVLLISPMSNSFSHVHPNLCYPPHHTLPISTHSWHHTHLPLLWVIKCKNAELR